MTTTITTTPSSSSYIAIVRHAKRYDQHGGDNTYNGYDTPILKSMENFELIQNAANKLKKYQCKIIISSPFKRCFETAVGMALELKINVIKIDNRLGEVMYQVRKYTNFIKEEDFVYCNMDEYKSILKEATNNNNTNEGKNIDIIWLNPTINKPSINETIDEFTKRTDMLLDIVKEHDEVNHNMMQKQQSQDNIIDQSNNNIIVVSHADYLSSWLQKLDQTHVYAPNECGFVVLNTNNIDKTITIEEKFRIEQIM